ncbi:PPC domain-containing protein [Verrucomicrobia bacterium]|nr:PPC domain-containing protein [Verrucomicrobiota bacterium]
MIRAAFAAILFSLTAAAAPPQVDWLFPMGAQRGSEALAQIGGKFQWPLKTWADDPGIAIRADAKKGFFKITVAKDVTPGPHLVRFYDANGTAPPRVFFVSKAPDVPEKEPNNEMLSPQSVDVLPAIIHGKLQSGGDVDSYRVKLKAGQFFIAQLDAYTAGVSMDALMLLRDHRGVKLAFNHDAHSLDPRLVWQCDRAGEYVLQVAAFKFPANSTSRFSGGVNHVYRLTLSNGPWIRHAWPHGAVAANKGSVGLIGWNLKSIFAATPENSSREIFVAVDAANGPLRLPVTSWPQLVERETNDTNSTAQPFAAPATLSGRIDKPGDIDRFAFSAKKGVRYRLDIDSFTLGFLLDARLSIEDSSGKELTNNDDANKNRDPLLNWTAPVAGRFCVVVRSLLNKGGGEYFYTLKIHQPEPSFSATVAAPQFAINAGVTNEVKVTVNYLDGYKGKLTVAAKGLPKGVSASPVIMEKKGTATLKLIAAKDASPHNAPLTITITPDGKSATPATVALTSASVNNGVPQGFPDFIIPTSPHLWLTVLPSKPPVKKPQP